MINSPFLTPGRIAIAYLPEPTKAECYALQL